MDWEFELNYQLQYAKEKKQERAKEKKEADKMQRAETEQCANGLDKFWVRIFFHSAIHSLTCHNMSLEHHRDWTQCAKRVQIVQELQNMPQQMQ